MSARVTGLPPGVSTVTPAVAAPGCSRTTSTRRETFRKVTLPDDPRFFPTSAGRASADGSATSSTADAAAGLTSPGSSPALSRRADVTSAPRRPAASRSGRASARSAADPATTAAAALDPLSVPYRAVPPSLRPGTDVTSPTPGAATSVPWLPSRARPVLENGATVRRSGFCPNAAAPTPSSTGTPAVRSRLTSAAIAAETPTTGTWTGSSTPSEPAGIGPSTRTARAPADASSPTASGVVGPDGSSTAPPATRL